MHVIRLLQKKLSRIDHLWMKLILPNFCLSISVSTRIGEDPGQQLVSIFLSLMQNFSGRITLIVANNVRQVIVNRSNNQMNMCRHNPISMNL